MLSDVDLLVRKLQTYGPLGPTEKTALSQIRRASVDLPAGEHIELVAEASSTYVVQLSGVACRYKEMPGAKRQILSFLLPGDICLLTGSVSQMDHRVVALTACRVIKVPYGAMQELTRQFPSIERLLWLNSLAEAAISREWMMSLARRSAYERIAHFLCEFKSRMEAVGLSSGPSFDFPISQVHLSEAFGLSVQHVNRVIQTLRRENIIVFRQRVITVIDWEGFHPVARHRPRQYLCGVAFLARQELRIVLHDGYVRAQPAKGLRQFAAQRASADDGETLR